MKMRLVDGYVVDLADDPAKTFHESIAKEFVDVPKGAPADLRPGYHFAEGVWTAPPEPVAVEPAAPAEPVAVYRTLVSVARFMAQFPLRSQIAIELARAYVPADPAKPDMEQAVKKAGLDVLYGMLAVLNQSNSPVDLSDPSVTEGVDWMAEQGFITGDQATVIKRGVLIPAGASA